MSIWERKVRYVKLGLENETKGMFEFENSVLPCCESLLFHCSFESNFVFTIFVFRSSIFRLFVV